MIEFCKVQCKECSNSADKCIGQYQRYHFPVENDQSLFYNNIGAEGYFLESNVWKKCNVQCKNCIGSANNCTQCANEFIALDSDKSNCFPRSTPGIIFDTNILNPYVSCHVSCATCNDSTENCLTCAANYYPKETDIGTTRICYAMTEDIPGFYFDEMNKLFKVCDVSCKTCEKNSKICEECASGFYKKEFDVYNLCFNSETIEKGYYFSEKDSLFKKCSDSCSECRLESTNCSICNEEMKYYKFDYKRLNDDKSLILNKMKYEEYSKFDFICLNSTLTGYFLDEGKKLYEKCNEKCSTCPNELKCILCDYDKNYFPIEDKIGGNLIF